MVRRPVSCQVRAGMQTAHSGIWETRTYRLLGSALLHQMQSNLHHNGAPADMNGKPGAKRRQ